jgi:hypothetical protein
MMLYFDNAITHPAKCTIDYLRENRLARAPYPTFPPDLAPLDFYLFGKLKISPMGVEFVDHNEILQSMMEAFTEIWREEIEAVSEEWLRRLDRCIQPNREYIE